MKLFILILTYQQPLTEVERYLSEHRCFLEKYYKSGNFIASGRQNPRVGGVILCHAKDRTFIDSAIKDDPFYVHSIAKYDIIEFEATMHSDKFTLIED